MKNLFFIALLFSSATCFAQKNIEGLFVAPKDKTGIYSFTVESTKPINKQTYSRSRQWAIANLKAEGIPENKLGVIAGKAFLTVAGLNSKKQYPFTARFQIDVTANKYSLRFYDLVLIDQNISVTQRRLIAHGSKTIPVAKAHLIVKKMGDVLHASMEGFKIAMEK